MNRRHLARHRVMLRNAFPLDGRALQRWLRDPVCQGAGAVNGLAFLANAGPGISNRRLGPTKRVRARTILANAAADRQQRENRGLRGRPGAVRASPGAPDPG